MTRASCEGNLFQFPGWSCWKAGATPGNLRSANLRPLSSAAQQLEGCEVRVPVARSGPALEVRPAIIVSACRDDCGRSY